MSDAIILAVLSAAFSFAGAWAAVRVQLQQIRLSVNAAHRRLDKINAPSAGEHEVGA